MLRHSLRWPLAGNDHDLRLALRGIPGVRVTKKAVVATEDAAAAVRALIGAGPAEVVGEVASGFAGNFTLPDKLFPWQREAAAALIRDEKRGLYHGCGLGKTATALAAAAATSNRVLFVTRAIGRDVFVRDSVWAAPGKRVSILVGRGGSESSIAAAKRADRRLADLRDRGAICNVSAIFDDVRDSWAITVGWEVLAAWTERLLAWSPDLIVFDEHHMGKGRGAERTKAAHALAAGVAERGGRVWSLTATPVRDRLRDLWAQLHCVAPASWGSSWTFAHRYCGAVPGRFGGLDTTGATNVDELRDRIVYWFDIRTRETIRGLLPAKSRNIVRLAIDQIKNQSAHVASTTEAAIAIAAETKLDFVVDRACEALVGGEKVVLVGNRRSWVPRACAAIERGLSKVRRTREALWIRTATGEVPVSDRQFLAREFMSQPAPAILIATIDSISESLDLQDADRLIVAALPYTPGQVDQLEGRVSRIGSRRPVTIDYVVADGTIDEVIEASLLAKLDSVVSAGVATDDVSIASGVDESEVIANLRAWLEKSEAA